MYQYHLDRILILLECPIDYRAYDRMTEEHCREMLMHIDKSFSENDQRLIRTIT
jgi:hypothetical protein